MCGIVGFVSARGAAPPDPLRLRDAVLALAHRGPNGSGTHESNVAALGNTRLSIIDLERGRQPMTNEDGSIIVVYNGEIWNYRALRSELVQLGHRFATESDTEVLVHGFEEWGLRLAERLDGMFAFAIWDEARATVYLARDRLGKKPLYIGHTEDGLAFGSDARSVLLVTGRRPEIAIERVPEYLFQRYLVSPRTLFAGIERVPPGHAVTYDRNSYEVKRYWKLEVPTPAVPLEADELRELLRTATERRLMSDVPLGVFLSGGVDSTSVLALLHEFGAEAPATFTVGFDDPVFDERPSARAAAAHYGTDHHELAVGRADFLQAWPRLAWYRDEPIAEASEIPLLLLSEFAGRHVRVVLSGDGGDEVFGGYPKYRADAILRFGGRGAAAALRVAFRLLAVRRSHRQLERAARTLSISDPYLRWVSWFRTADPDAFEGLFEGNVANGPVPERLARDLRAMLEPYAAIDEARQMLIGDLFTYLPDNMLLRSDKVLMAGSLEGRMPLVDVDVVQRTMAAEARARASLLRSKRVLKEATASLVPRELRRGPKRGFPVPIERFLVEGGRAFVEKLLLSDHSLDRGIFRADAVRAAVQGNVGERLPDAAIFVLASLELWARANIDRVTTTPLPLEELVPESA